MQTILRFDITQLRTLIQQVLQLPDGSVIGGWLPENTLAAFITADVLSVQEIGIAKREFNGHTERIISHLETTVSISCYGNNAVLMANKLRTLLQSSRMIDRFKALHWGLLRFSEVRNLTATVGADYQERGQFDCVFNHSQIIETPLDPIQQVDVLHHSNQFITQIKET